ncbi:hypothetical protein WEI85_02875 [Actinomycetes bacterium KLBMP 9797]
MSAAPSVAASEAPPAEDAPGWLARWASADPVRAVALGLIAAQLIWRAQVASRGYLAVDDWAMVSRVGSSDPVTVDLFTGLFNNHLMPGGLLVTWAVTQIFGLAYWPYVVLMITAQAVLGVAFYRLLRQLLPARWGLLIPLAVFLFSPLTLEATSWWAVGINLLPMQLAMVWAVGAQVKYVRTLRKRHLVSLAAGVLFGLLFFEKALLIVALVFLATACLFVRGGPLRTVVRTVRRYWLSWLVLTVISVGYLALYLTRSQSSLREPTSSGEVVTFVREMIAATLLPGLLGGPWRWLDAEDGTPVVSTIGIAQWLSVAVFLALIVVTVRLRRSAGRAWTLLGLYLAIVVVLLAATRLGSMFSGVAGLVPRYVGEVVLIAALCIGVALFGVDGVDRPARWPAFLKEHQPVTAPIAVVFAALVAVGTVWSTTGFSDSWADKRGRDYLRNAEAALATAPPGTVFLDTTVPPGVLGPLSAPYNVQSRFFQLADPEPTFVTSAENPSVFNGDGRIRPARVEGVANRPGPEGQCGYRVTGGSAAVPIPLTNAQFEWTWVIRIGYLSNGDTVGTVRFGGEQRQFDVHRGLHQIFLVMDGGGNTVELTVADPAITLCTNEVTVGTPAPS